MSPSPPVPPGAPGRSPEVLSQPAQEEELSDLELQDVEEAQMGRDTCWPGERAKPAPGAGLGAQAPVVTTALGTIRDPACPWLGAHLCAPLPLPH